MVVELFILVDHKGKFFSQCVCQLLKGLNGRDRIPALYLPKEAPTKPRQVRQSLLRQAPPLAEGSDNTTKFDSYGRHKRSLFENGTCSYAL